MRLSEKERTGLSGLSSVGEVVGVGGSVDSEDHIDVSLLVENRSERDILSTERNELLAAVEQARGMKNVRESSIGQEEFSLSRRDESFGIESVERRRNLSQSLLSVLAPLHTAGMKDAR